MKPGQLILLSLIFVATAPAQLAVTVTPPKVTGNKAVVKLELKNKFTEKIESARAVCFLLDEQGKVVGQSTQWVIGGSLQTATGSTNALFPGATNRFHFVIATDRATTTNLSARISFSRIVLEGGKLADMTTAAQIQFTPK